MAPNLLLKAGFVRGDYDSKEEVTKCRTDFILQNCYSHLVGNGNDFQPMSARNSKEERVLMIFKTVIDEFRDSYANPIQEMARKMKHISVDLLPELLRSVSAELFCEGVTWSKVIGFFVFVGELAIHYAPNDESSDVINKLYESFCRHVKENLISWVEEHGGWEGVESLAKKRDSTPKIDTTSSDLNTTKSFNQGWYKNFATGAFRVVGTLVQLASPHVQSYA
ncbi:unnamed protein product [Larinioides sclopetarius]|uniref:Bcl-2 Bcl-2 homology region 1-3 domain-containing protein n=1 Tax=Larinioides sclopetarius TaxID=280406 RepID=A0AAV1ZJM8_9ARAC